MMDYRVDLVVLSEKDNLSRFGLTLHNLSDVDLHHWQFHFTIDRFIAPNSNTQGTLEQVGSFCKLIPNVNQVLKANNHYYIEFSIGTAPFRFISDGLDDAAIFIADSEKPQFLEVSISPIVLASPHTKRTQIPRVAPAELSLIPKPESVQRLDGLFNLNDVSLEIQTHLAEGPATWLSEELEIITSKSHPISESGKIQFIANPTLDRGAYQVLVTEDKVTLHAGSTEGFAHACATLLQLINEETQLVACVKIKDQPRFHYRGMMLDCARHFHPLERVKRLINQLAQYKFNVFHWHLTDDEGWRVEIKAFPELTQVGAWRGSNHLLEPQYTHVASSHGGFYSQEEIKEVIAYAEVRGITVIPEIDIPGHCRAAIKALPHLLVDTDDHSNYRSIQHYTDNVLSPALEGTYTFIDTVLEEVAALFPAPYIHIGADEVPKGVWTDSQKCQELMEQQGYSDPVELQGHLLRHAETKLKQLGKRMLGWEEAQHGNKVSKDTVIYSWLSEEAALNCAKQGFDVVLQPGQTTYLDMAQDYAPEEPGVDWANVLPLEDAYNYEPLAELADNDPIRKRILGIQCALWCEIINNQERMDYMIFPRLLAMSEGMWTQKQHRNWTDFLSRLNGRLPTLTRQGINFRQP
ncbi:beta-hexosaminidase [Aliivibrio finisterrensis]|uniref:beta-N-acetylhexosaminidase n=2 Tax=Vibrionaceae TaxID=641 RepID=A0A4Q5KV86_9GAMM|nr:beta-hexosaminidase [Aliivibrio finisterrensis]RYU50137.1 beta-hexosaminidase [Aliivibrio finisterrensis]RYU55918.1 beta-hexosaminidase [Aliivibrio finisterrensis]RYU62231.1 beta-hexosaminidase [Aliivibrio finisterrensis]RYU81122.1 beta-hexosaminidase [Aliivibrio finisterrensis]